MADDGLDRWRGFFRGAGVGICEAIEKAILVAAADEPQEFLRRRDRIAERLFNALLARPSSCHGCTASTGSAPPATPAVAEDKGSVRRVPDKDCKVDSSSLGAPGGGALGGGISEDDDSDSEDDERLRRAAASNYGHLALALIQDWKILVDEWVSTTNVALADNSPGTSNPSVVDDDDEEEGLPSPPLDEGAFFAPETTAIQLSEFFDEMDEDGNLRHNNDARLGNKRENNGRRPVNHSTVSKPELTRPVGTVGRDQFRRPELTRQEPPMRHTNQQKPQGSNLQAKPQGMLNKQSRPLSSDSGSMRPMKAATQQKPIGEMKYKQTQEHFGVERKPAMGHVDKSRLRAQPSSGVRLESARPKTQDGLESNVRLEVAKRRLQERYQEAENAKKQRTIQVMELGDIPKPKSNTRQPMVKSRNNIRSRVLGRR
ncbi:unnamed protein product [Triticum turgidum subsp. durum]|uniref:Uncharacterized protein n=1 Tax=Triticum turgidum subsp. durum TaxID=4567 RepID=A0A9R0QCE1_TRITD|nr:unnamed protein product [Triticum turgidum subsp. durum]